MLSATAELIPGAEKLIQVSCADGGNLDTWAIGAVLGCTCAGFQEDPVAVSQIQCPGLTPHSLLSVVSFLPDF